MNKLINLGLGHVLNRRSFLSVLAGTALLGLAGCSTGNGGAADGGSAGAAELGDDLLAQIKGRGEMILPPRALGAPGRSTTRTAT